MEGGGFCSLPPAAFLAAFLTLGLDLMVAAPPDLPAFFLPPAPFATALPLDAVRSPVAADGIASPRSRASWHASAYLVVKSKLACVRRECVALSYTSEACVSMLCWY